MWKLPLRIVSENSIGNKKLQRRGEITLRATMINSQLRLMTVRAQ